MMILLPLVQRAAVMISLLGRSRRGALVLVNAAVLF